MASSSTNPPDASVPAVEGTGGAADSGGVAGVAGGGWSAEEILIELLREEEIECPLCGYNLHQLVVPRCPECGNALRLVVTTPEPYLRAYITLLTTLLLDAGIGMLFAFIVAEEGWPKGVTSQVWAITLNVTLGYFMLTVPCGASCLFLRAAFLRLPRRLQWAMARVTVFCSAAVFLSFLCGILLQR